jgi:hypothetical protein
MSQTIVKPLTTSQNGGNGYVPPPPPPPPPVVTIGVSAPANSVGNNPGVSLSIISTVNVKGLITNELWAATMNVYVQIGSASYAETTMTRPAATVCTHGTPTDAPLQPRRPIVAILS